MIKVQKKIVLDKKGNPTEVIIPWKVYKEMEELLGLDLDKNDVEDIRQAKEDREKGKKDAYVEVDSLWYIMLSSTKELFVISTALQGIKETGLKNL